MPPAQTPAPPSAAPTPGSFWRRNAPWILVPLLVVVALVVAVILLHHAQKTAPILYRPN